MRCSAITERDFEGGQEYASEGLGGRSSSDAQLGRSAFVEQLCVSSMQSGR